MNPPSVHALFILACMALAACTGITVHLWEQYSLNKDARWMRDRWQRYYQYDHERDRY